MKISSPISTLGLVSRTRTGSTSPAANKASQAAVRFGNQNDSASVRANGLDAVEQQIEALRRSTRVDFQPATIKTSGLSKEEKLEAVRQVLASEITLTLGNITQKITGQDIVEKMLSNSPRDRVRNLYCVEGRVPVSRFPQTRPKPMAAGDVDLVRTLRDKYNSEPLGEAVKTIYAQLKSLGVFDTKVKHFDATHLPPPFDGKGWETWTVVSKFGLEALDGINWPKSQLR
jgi:hypothetical protein